MVFLLMMKKTTENTSFNEITYIAYKLTQNRYRMSKTMHVYLGRFWIQALFVFCPGQHGPTGVLITVFPLGKFVMYKKRGGGGLI